MCPVKMFCISIDGKCGVPCIKMKQLLIVILGYRGVVKILFRAFLGCRGSEMTPACALHHEAKRRFPKELVKVT
jgi:hypothetical protein